LRQLTLRALNQVEADFAPLAKGSETLHLDRREVGKNVLSSIFRLDKAETLSIVKPFDSAYSHKNPRFIADEKQN
jgi:hypothetical protein